MNKSNSMVEMKTLDAIERNKSFEEVALGYSYEEALEEAERCINCKNKPCVKGCPVNVQIPDFISLVKKGDIAGAYEKIKETNGLPAICGRVCPQESQCELNCVRKKNGDAVGIGRLERFCADWYMTNDIKTQDVEAKPLGKKVAVIGSGPAGLAAASELITNGVDVTIYEAFHCAGGVLVYGIPEFRLPKRIVEYEIGKLKEAGVNIETNVLIGKTYTIDDLWEMGYDAIFIGTGAGLPHFLGIPGENSNGVYSANEFLTRINLMKAYQFPKYKTPINIGAKVVVIGGGNVAIDAARCALRAGAQEVRIVYRRSMEELPARHEEIDHAIEEGVIFELLNSPRCIVADESNNVCGLECTKMMLGEPDDSGRRTPVPIDNSEHIIGADTVVVAIGQSPNPMAIQGRTDIERNKRGGILTLDPTSGITSHSDIYAGGDAVTGAATVIQAMGAGRDSARAMIGKFGRG